MLVSSDFMVVTVRHRTTDLCYFTNPALKYVLGDGLTVLM